MIKWESNLCSIQRQSQSRIKTLSFYLCRCDVTSPSPESAAKTNGGFTCEGASGRERAQTSLSRPTERPRERESQSGSADLGSEKQQSSALRRSFRQ